MCGAGAVIERSLRKRSAPAAPPQAPDHCFQTLKGSQSKNVVIVRCGVRTHAIFRLWELKSHALDHSANLTRWIWWSDQKFKLLFPLYQFLQVTEEGPKIRPWNWSMHIAPMHLYILKILGWFSGQSLHNKSKE